MYYSIIKEIKPQLTMDVSLNHLSDSVREHGALEQFLPASCYDIERSPKKKQKEIGRTNHGIYQTLHEERSVLFQPRATDSDKQPSHSPPVNLSPHDGLGQQQDNVYSERNDSLVVQDEHATQGSVGTRYPQAETVPMPPNSSVVRHPVPQTSFPCKACLMYKNDQYSLDPKLLSLPRATKYLVKVRTEISPGCFMAKLELHCAR